MMGMNVGTVVSFACDQEAANTVLIDHRARYGLEYTAASCSWEDALYWSMGSQCDHMSCNQS